jgi:hypothetical protein
VPGHSISGPRLVYYTKRDVGCHAQNDDRRLPYTAATSGRACLNVVSGQWSGLGHGCVALKSRLFIDIRPPDHPPLSGDTERVQTKSPSTMTLTRGHEGIARGHADPPGDRSVVSGQ